MNKRYVDIDKFKEQIQKAVDNYWLGFSNGYYLAEDVIEEINYGNLDIADVEEIKHGTWIERIEKPEWLEDDVEVSYECSCCGIFNFGQSPYCPACGAKMIKE